ncbi:hypothetical protein M409DRAFT_22515 [Zasmidium cellare ATCC 36951]|uniref:F-box domain-containing protein n=1 Tax=Zasmidium cellare ATCC 36951 TaxID=1080233 RepID=A0A6A6CJ65_ZASCE|nr:uncharacterized protein M409DRAFT_22515 [Zasmidium cellare ATCC 36951]KAF2167081.1 hypothetical protein M409DRAFT_22515 [Zasmidium cellare ATCC 36951]
MEDTTDPSLLLNLAPELRTLIWEALFSEPSERTIDEYVHPNKKPLRKDILSITLVNQHLRHETLPIYWSHTIFRVLHRGHREDSAFDAYFYTWLQRLRDEDVKLLRHLEFKVRVPYVLPKPESLRDPSTAIINVDLNCPHVDEGMKVRGYYETCPLAILPWVRRAVAKVPRVERKPIVSKEVLWDIYEACYLLTRSDCRERRTWAEFQRAYELNQSRAKPLPWSENLYYEMSQEVIHGPAWREREELKKIIGLYKTYYLIDDMMQF